jgi:hypothetical protein
MPALSTHGSDYEVQAVCRRLDLSVDVSPKNMDALGSKGS